MRPKVRSERYAESDSNMANVKRNQLSPLQVKNLSKPGSYTDGGGLMLKVHRSGGRQWLLRLTINGIRRNMGLGGYPDVSLAEARRRAQKMRTAIQEGRDPIAERKALAAFSTVARNPYIRRRYRDCD